MSKHNSTSKPAEPAVNYLGIDVETRGAGFLVSRLKRLKTTIAIENTGKYSECREWSKVFIDTVMTEDQLDNWLYETRWSPKPYDASVFTRKNYLKSEGYLWERKEAVPIAEL
jgi:hypothetical protein